MQICYDSRETMTSHLSHESEGPVPAADSSRPEEAPRFRSPKRTLARSSLLSRDRWKAKATVRREQLRAMKVRLRDVEASRDLWKQKALQLHEQMGHLMDSPPSPLTEDGAPNAPPQPSLADSGSPTPGHAAGLGPLSPETAPVEPP